MIAYKDRKRYYLHAKMKEFGFTLDITRHEVDVFPYSCLEEIPVGPRYYVNQLIKMGYNVQIKMF